MTTWLGRFLLDAGREVITELTDRGDKLSPQARNPLIAMTMIANRAAVIRAKAGGIIDIKYLRQNYLANRVFETYDDIVDACCDAGNSLARQPDRITSIATRERALQVKLWCRWYKDVKLSMHAYSVISSFYPVAGLDRSESTSRWTPWV